jgi:hypothetical protein
MKPEFNQKYIQIKQHTLKKIGLNNKSKLKLENIMKQTK